MPAFLFHKYKRRKMIAPMFFSEDKSTYKARVKRLRKVGYSVIEVLKPK